MITLLLSTSSVIGRPSGGAGWGMVTMQLVVPGVVIVVGTQLSPTCCGGGSTVIEVLVLTPEAATYRLMLLALVTGWVTVALKVAELVPAARGT